MGAPAVPEHLHFYSVVKNEEVNFGGSGDPEKYSTARAAALPAPTFRIEVHSFQGPDERVAHAQSVGHDEVQVAGRHDSFLGEEGEHTGEFPGELILTFSGAISPDTASRHSLLYFD